MTQEQIIDLLCSKCSKKVLDWDAIKDLVIKLKPVINDIIHTDETILSLLYCYFNPQNGDKLTELTELFIENGYNVNANDGSNGGICLHQLCWSECTEHITEVAKILLDYGANPFYFVGEEDEDIGILNSIAWKLGYWIVGDMYSANIYEAYYELIDYAQKGLDYHKIFSVTQCINKPLRKVEKALVDDKEILIFWFDEYPLIASHYLDFIVNQLTVSSCVNKTDITEQFSEIIGSNFKNLYFLSQEIAYMRFDNKKRLLFTRTFNSNNSKGLHTALLDDKNYFADLLHKKVDYVFTETGKTYAEDVKRYNEDTLILKCGDNLWAIGTTLKSRYKNQLVCTPLKNPEVFDITRKIKNSQFVVEELLKGKSGTVWGVHLSSPERHLYLRKADFRGIEFVFTSKPVSDLNTIAFNDCEKMDFE